VTAPEAQRGTGRTYLLSRLRVEHPELALLVETGEISAYRAGCEAGICTPRFSLHGYDPDVLAKAMRRNLPADVLAAVVARLAAEAAS
jgi:hypothetical protein